MWMRWILRGASRFGAGLMENRLQWGIGEAMAELEDDSLERKEQDDTVLEHKKERHNVVQKTDAEGSEHVRG